MSAPKFVNTKDGTCWTRRAATRGGLALYAPEGVCNCPEFVMATEAELAELGIVGSADVLPVPVGPQRPPFPPAPRAFEEKLRQDVARLQGLLAEAVRDAHRARSERDQIRERVSEPFGCKHCGVEKRSHGRRYIGGQGMHAWERPSDEQVKSRMLARRAARFTSHVERLAQLLVARTEDLLAAESRIAALLEERRSTNEALDDAVQELRARQSCPCPPENPPGPHQLGCPQAEVPSPLFPTVAALREVSSREEPHDSPLRQSHRLGHDLPETGGAPTPSASCKACGSAPESWCPDCAACQKGCFGGFEANPCTHPNASWGGPR